MVAAGRPSNGNWGTAKDRTFVKGHTADAFLNDAEQRRLVPDMATLQALMTQLDVHTVATLSEPQLKAIPLGPPLPSRADGHLYNGSGPEVYVMQGGQRRWIPDPQTFGFLGLSWGAIVKIADGDLTAIPLGPPLPSRADGHLYNGHGPEVYLMQGGQRRWIPDPQTFGLMGLSWGAIITIADGDLNAIPLGPPMPHLSPSLPNPDDRALGSARDIVKEGTWFRDAKRRYVLFRGVNFGARSKLRPYLPIMPLHVAQLGAAAFHDELRAVGPQLDLLKHLGFNIVRLLVMWKGIEPRPNPLPEQLLPEGKQYLGFVNEVIDALYSRGMYVFLDFHQDIAHEVCGGDGFPDWALAIYPGLPRPAPADMKNRGWALLYYDNNTPGYTVDDTVRQTLKAFWNNHLRNTDAGLPDYPVQTHLEKTIGSTAAFFKDHPAVLGYEAFNEPPQVGIDKTIFESNLLPGYYTKVQEEVKKTDNRAFLFLEPRVDWTMFDPETPEPSFGILGVHVSPFTLKPRSLLPTDPHAPPMSAFQGRGVFSFHHYDPWTLFYASLPVPSGDDMHKKQAEWPDIFSRMRDAATSRGLIPFLTEFGGNQDWWQFRSDLRPVPYRSEQIRAYMDLQFQQIEAFLLNATYWHYDLYNTADLKDNWNLENFSLLGPDRRPRNLDIVARPYPLRGSAQPTLLAFDLETLHCALIVEGPVVDAPTVIYVPHRVGYASGFEVRATSADVKWDADEQLLYWRPDAGQSVNQVVISPARRFNIAFLPRRSQELQSRTPLRFSWGAATAVREAEWDSLRANQQLNVNDQLVSTNGLFNLILQGDGNLVIYRTAFGQPLWASGTAGKPVKRIVMQTDGNLVAYDGGGTACWDTKTNGKPGARVLLQDDGNLVVYDSASKPLWASNTAQDPTSPTFQYGDGRGYRYDETSESWKQFCSGLPCFLALQWPDYVSGIVEDTINRQPVVIQYWKGWCQQFLGQPNFPGGVGAEVGVYRRMPGRARPTAIPFFPPPLAQLAMFILDQIAKLSDNDLWWPFPELGAKVEYTLTNPVTGQTFFSAGPERSYWLAKWMNTDSYSKYQRDQDSQTPFWSADYQLDFKVNDKSYFGLRSKEAPAFAALGNRLVMSFVDDSAAHNLLVCTSADGSHWSGSQAVKQRSKTAPTLAVLGNQLVMAFVADNASNTLLVCTSSDGVNWTANHALGERSKTAPALAVLGNRLVMAFVADNASNTLLVCTSGDGVNWSANHALGERSKTAPALAALGNQLVMAFVADNASNSLLVCTSGDGVTWSPNHAVNQASKTAPGLSRLANQLVMGFVANNPTDTLLVSTSADGTTWSANHVVF